MANSAEIEKMSFREKQKYFEKEIKEAGDSPASKPQDGSEDMSPDQDLDQVLSRMKSLEADAVQAQAVIAKAHELSKDSNSAGLHSVDIAYADDESETPHPNHNGDSRVEVTRQQMYGMKLRESQH